jgi:hypothetical protein
MPGDAHSPGSPAPALLSLQEKGEGPDPAVALRKHWKPITLSRDTTSAREILEEILRDSDEKFELPDDWQPKPISVKFDGATFWQAVDEVCRLDGALGLSLDRGRFSLVKKPRDRRRSPMPDRSGSRFMTSPGSAN